MPGVATEDLALILTHTGDEVWEALRGQRIFMTGGTGFIGCWLLEGLLWANQQRDLGLQLSVLSRHPEAFRAKAPHLANHPAVTLLSGDTASLDHVDGHYDVVLHAATDVIGPSADPLAVYHDIVDGTRQTLRLAERCGASRYLLTSSGAVYGPQPPAMQHMPEDYRGAPDLSQPGTAYGQGKRAAEWLVACQRQRQALATRIVRIYALTGPYMVLDAQFAIGNFIQDYRCGRPIRVNNGAPYRSYLYAADLVVWLLTILVHGDQQPYNVGSDEAIRIETLAHRVNTVLGGERVVQSTAQPPAAPNYYVPSVARANALGLRPYTNLDEAIRRTARWTAPSPENPTMSVPPLSDSRALAQRIRQLALTMCHRKNASHVGGAFSAADILAVLYHSTMTHRPAEPSWPGRDRLFYSKGHACTALYAVLAEQGYFPHAALDTFTDNGSLLTSHVNHKVAGVELSTGSLGHALSVACGVALAGQRQARDWHTYAILSDGELDEGSNWEAILFAPHHGLDRLTLVVDYNKIQSLGHTAAVLNLEPLADKLRSFGWDTQEIDGHDHAALAAALARQGRTPGKPRAVIAHTIKGKGVDFMEGQLAWHYKSPNADQYQQAMAQLTQGQA